MTFWQHFKKAWGNARLNYTYDTAMDTPEGWTKDDAAYLQSVLNTNMGQKLRQQLQNYVIRTADVAIQQPKDHEWHAGIANGARMLVMAIEQLYASSRRTEDNSDEQPTDAEAEVALR